VYSVTFTLTGFNTVKRDAIELTGNFVAPVSVELKVGSVQETVTVTGETPVVDVQSAKVQQTVQISGTIQSVPGPVLAGNYNAPNAVIQPSLGRPLTAQAPNQTVNLVKPGTFYGDRINQLDMRPRSCGSARRGLRWASISTTR
jgi:hypothetical protein